MRIFHQAYTQRYSNSSYYIKVMNYPKHVGDAALNTNMGEGERTIDLKIEKDLVELVKSVDDLANTAP